MTLDRRALRPYAPLAILLVTIGLGWMVFVRPLSADRAQTRAQLERLRGRALALEREVSTPLPRASAVDPEVAFERRVADGDGWAMVLEPIARLASAAPVRNLLIETVEATAGSSAPGQAPQRDPRLALFDVPVSHVPIRIAFDADYAGLGRFLWAFRDLPTTVEIRSLSVALPASDEDEPRVRTDALRVALTLHAYSRSGAAMVRTASNTVTR